MKKAPSLILILNFCFLINATAQDCKVSVDALQGKYEGSCKNGKAEGPGKAEGTDTYEGNFKGGLPDGQGKYTWKNGDWYEGAWVKGRREGNGKMMYKSTEKDSLINGYWKKDAYTGQYEKPYLIHYRTKKVTQLSVQLRNKTLDQVEITLDSETGNSPVGIGSNSLVPKPEITDFLIATGNYIQKRVNDSYGKKIIYTLEKVTFPFRVTLNMGVESVDLEFLEAGRYEVIMRLAL